MFRKFFLCLALTLSISVNAQESATEVSESKAYSETTDLLATACQLVKYGYRTKTALPFIQAVEICQRVGIRPSTEVRQKTTVVDSVADVVTEKVELRFLDVPLLLDEAVKYADGDENLLKIIQSLGETRGNVFGPLTDYGTIKPYSTDRIVYRFEGGEEAIITVIGDGDTNLDLYVCDSNENLVVFDNFSNFDCSVSFTPIETSDFIVKVRNLGSMPNCYYISTN